MTLTAPTFLSRPLWRPVLPHTALNLIVTTYILWGLNTGFWSRLTGVLGGNPVQIGLFGLAMLGLTMATLEFLAPGRLQKPVAAVLIVIAAAANHFEQAFGVLIDREMVRNVLETTPTEAQHLLTPGMVGQITLTGVLPALLVFWPRVRRLRPLHQLWRWPLGVGLGLALLVGGVLGDYKAVSSMLRERKDVMGAYQPGATLAAVLRYGRQELRGAPPVAAPIGTDARPGARLAAAQKPVLLVLFAGETARAQNFGLNGYARDTTPQLAARRDVVNFTDVTACGTSTAVSLPCMFSPLTEAEYKRDRFLAQENLLDVLRRAGFDVEWHDNNTGDQKIATRTSWQKADPALMPEACTGECTDEIFLPLIADRAARITRNTVLVLHMIGSHGPAYHLRYPPARARFTPDCRSVQFSECSPEEIVNAYDNSILQTDHVLARSIETLDAADRVLPALIYLSDHGESLGEDGLYLHAAPKFMAPEVQTKVPMLIWMGGSYATALDVTPDCLRRASDAPIRHDHLFHTVLGLLDVTTSLREPALDLAGSCR